MGIKRKKKILWNVPFLLGLHLRYTLCSIKSTLHIARHGVIMANHTNDSGLSGIAMRSCNLMQTISRKFWQSVALSANAVKKKLVMPVLCINYACASLRVPWILWAPRENLLVILTGSTVENNSAKNGMRMFRQTTSCQIKAGQKFAMDEGQLRASALLVLYVVMSAPGKAAAQAEQISFPFPLPGGTAFKNCGLEYHTQPCACMQSLSCTVNSTRGAKCLKASTNVMWLLCGVQIQLLHV